MASHFSPAKSVRIMRRYDALKAQQAARDGQASAPLAKRAAIEFFRQAQIEVYAQRRDRYVSDYMRIHRGLMAA